MSYRLLRQLLFSLDPEHAHDIVMRGLALLPDAYWRYRYRKKQGIYQQPLKVCGIHFKNPVGLAAGFDKNAECIAALASMGFGFVEVGTVVPQPQPGNPRPRLFRLIEDQALINRFGFNSKGVDYVVQKLRQRPAEITLGVNIAKNKKTPLSQASDDYVICMRKLYAYADYITINVSSPNTPQLRQLETNPVLFKQLFSVLQQEQQSLEQQHGHHVPLFIKLSPDENPTQIQPLVDALLTHQMDGVVISNTTISRDAVASSSLASEVGGLSGKPLAVLSNQMIARIRQASAGELPIIGVGGVMSAADAQLKLQAGAQLLQLYSGLIYHGPGLIGEILRDLYKDQ